MEHGFVKFTQTNQRYEDRITVTGTNTFGFPTRFYENNNIKTYKYVVLYYDAIKKSVGLHFTNSETEEHKFTIIKSKQGYGGSVVATSFFKSYNIDAKKYHGRYTWEKKEYPDTGELFVITLKENPKFVHKTVLPSENVPVTPSTASS